MWLSVLTTTLDLLLNIKVPKQFIPTSQEITINQTIIFGNVNVNRKYITSLNFSPQNTLNSI